MKSLIYGYGITGKSFERYLKAKNIEYDIYDKNIDIEISELKSYKTIYCSPGVDRETFKLLKSSSEVLTDLDIFLQEDRSIKIGVTGTNRKSTTCFHLHQIFEKHTKVNLIGNIGDPMLDHINNGSQYSIIELSSFQLDKANKTDLDFGILLNITPDHLDYHETFENYKKAKQKLLNAKNVSYENNPFQLYQWITGESPKHQVLKDLPFRFQKITNSIINDSHSCVFVTLDSNQNPVSRLMDPHIYSNDFEIYLVTNPKSRKVSHLLNNDRISLNFISKDGDSYVSINGNAVLINELSQKNKYWKSSWTPHYKDLDNDCILIKINIRSLEIVSSINDISSDPVTWEPTTIIF